MAASAGAWQEIKQRQPGMTPPISLAITVAFVASWARTLHLGGFDLDFWWSSRCSSLLMLSGIRWRCERSAQPQVLAALLPDSPSETRQPDRGRQPCRTRRR